MRYQIRSLGLGGVLDQAIGLIRDHFGLLFGIVGLTIIPYVTVVNLLVLSTDSMQTKAIIAGISNLLAAILLYPIVNAAVIQGVASVYLSRPTSVGGSLRHGLSRFVPLLGTSILMGLAIMGGIVLLIIPGILFMLWFMLAHHVVVIEGTAGGSALGRSKALMKGNIGSGFVLGFVVGVINFFLGVGAGLIPQPHMQAVAVSVVQGVSTMIATSAFVVFYFSCRCKNENFDLQMLAEAVEAEAVSGDVA